MHHQTYLPTENTWATTISQGAVHKIGHAKFKSFHVRTFPFGKNEKVFDGLLAECFTNVPLFRSIEVLLLSYETQAATINYQPHMLHCNLSTI